MDILIVEDNHAHLKITQHILRKQNVKANFFVVRDGQEALDYLFHRPPYHDEKQYPEPHLILLDLNLPKKDGREVLQVVKSDPRLREIPVVIVSTSDRPEDIEYANAWGVASYISKSSGFDTFAEQLGAVTQFARTK
jgi:two-component system response regulator